ncbi:MAG: PHP domain-containing protein [Burkholderiaceae bacterium]|nr:PHP domain-containing protein [Burkholderiaceae bacterium]
MTRLQALNADLHAHSTVSDGTLAPPALVHLAAQRGVELFALTDHDEIGGLAAAQQAARDIGLRFVPGVEISVTFAGQTVHVVGLGIDAGCAELVAGLARVRAGRLQRAQEMAAQLARVGIEGALEGALAFAGNLNLLSRTHFARWLVASGHCGSVREVFCRYLVAGKPGYVPHRWADLADAVGWIRAAGGVAVLAHPGRYKFDEAGFDALLVAFREAGGEAIEVATSNHDAEQQRRFARVARAFGLEASRGSDFHDPAEAHTPLGGICALPQELTPVWHRFL